MRVIAGRLGGRRLRAPKGQSTRPSSDRVREALFSMLEDLEGVRALDLFAGTGALGIEALSRGGRCAVFVEQERLALAALKANLAALGLCPPTAEVRARDAFAMLEAAAQDGEAYDLVFLDPPYAQTSAWLPRLELVLPSVMAKGARVVLERDRRTPLALGLHVERERRYGDTSITIHRQR